MSAVSVFVLVATALFLVGTVGATLSGAFRVDNEPNRAAGLLVILYLLAVIHEALV